MAAPVVTRTKGDAMPELSADLFITVDGFAAGSRSAAYFGYFGPDLERWINDELDRPQLVILGRTTYQALSSIPADARDRSTQRMSGLPKLVFSRTLREPPVWPNTRITPRALVEEIGDLKAGGGDPLRTMGSLSVVRQLLSAGLVDRLRLVVFPQILGETGRQPAFADLPDLDLELSHQEVLDSRVLVLEYRPRSRAG